VVKAKRIIVIGDVMLDVIVQPSEPVAPTSDTASNVRIARGGSGANIAVALASAGHRVSYVGAAADDLAGRMCRDELLLAGVDPQIETVRPATGVVVALVDAEGQRSMMTSRGANRHLSEAFVLSHLSQPLDHLHVSGYTLLDDASRRAGSAALAWAREAGCRASVDVCSVGPLFEVTPSVFLAAARDASTVFANEEEAMVLSGTEDAADALEVLALLFDEVVVTLGARGAAARRGEQGASVASRVEEVLDTTGAGDAATGAYLAARLEGHSMEESLGEAMSASAVVVRGLGSRG
jgi:sugar/nucleoside kinase (ribokinase family)